MLLLMNNARYGVGFEAIGICEALGWQTVPLTVARPTGPFGEGSVQLWVDEAEDGPLVDVVEPGLLTIGSPRFFGWVMGGTPPRRARGAGTARVWCWATAPASSTRITRGR